MNARASMFYRLLAIVLAAAVLTGCVTQAVALGESRATEMAASTAKAQPEKPAPAANSSAATPQSASQPVAAKPSTEGAIVYTLTTGMSPEGKMAFLGVGGDIDGQANPTLSAKTGQTVEIHLVNGDNIQHNLDVPQFNALSSDVAKQGEETVLTFQPNQAGDFEYYCNIPGHKQAGMLGTLSVAQGENMPEQAAAPTEAMNMGAAPTAAPALLAPVDTSTLPSVARHPDDLPAPITRRTPETVKVELETKEVTARLADGTSYTFWTFNGLVPGPMLRVRVGDTVDVTLRNPANSSMAHSVDFHAATGPGGGAVFSQTPPGGESHFTFKALNPGLFVYHCATPSVATHISNGMYGMILVEPEDGLPAVEREFYVMQGELYTTQPFGSKGALTFDYQKLLNEQPEYFIFNGAPDALTEQAPLKANVGDTVRIFFGVGGPNATSSFHVIGEIFDRVFAQASLTSAPLTDVQTTTVAPGGAVMVEFAVQYPGRYLLVDHALSRLERGLVGFLLVEGEPDPTIIDGTATAGSGH